MKKLILSIVLLLGIGSLKAEEGVLFDVGSVKVLLPFADVSATYLFDTKSKTSLVGAETPLIQWHKVQLTGGAVTSLEGEGSPFVGLNLAMDNPVKNFVALSDLKLGVFAGRNFNSNEWMIGAKAGVSIFN